jgi:DNA polymerase-3 subunit beta
MRVTVLADALTRELGLLSRASARKAALAAYSCVRLEYLTPVGGQALRAVALDGHVDMRTELASEPLSVAEPGVVVVPIEKLRELADTLGKDAITLSLRDGKLQVTGDGLSAALQTLPADDFPRVAPAPSGGATLLAGPLRRLLALTRYAISPKEDNRYAITGVQMEFETADTVRLVATDGLRLATAVASRPADSGALPASVVVPRRVVELLQAALDSRKDDDPVVLGRDESGRMFFTVGPRVVSSSGVDGAFPAWRKIVPKAAPTAAQIKGDALKLALRRVAIVSDRDRATLELSTNTLRIKAANADVGAADQTLAVDYTGEPVTVVLRVAQVADFLDAVAVDTVALEATGDRSVLWRAAGAVACDYVLAAVKA